MADNYMDDPVVSHLRKCFYGSDEASSADLFKFYQDEFAKLPPAGRHSDLLQIDHYLNEAATTVTRENASLVSMRRQLGDVHKVLLKAGR
jgi:hypothetical protein